MAKRIISILILFSFILSIAPITIVEAGTMPGKITQPVDEFTPYRESKNFLCDLPSYYFRGKITPEQLGWYLGEMDKLYDAMADFVGGAGGWLPSSRFTTWDTRKIRLAYEPHYSDYMTAFTGRTIINFSKSDMQGDAVADTVGAIRRGQVYLTPVHELGHCFGNLPGFNWEWTAEFLTLYSSISTGIKLDDRQVRWHGFFNEGTLDSWYQLEYHWQARTDIYWGPDKIHNTRYGSRLNCAILDYVRDYGWQAISEVFGSYHDGSYPYDGMKYEVSVEANPISSFRAVPINEFIDRIDYFTNRLYDENINFRTDYLSLNNWNEYIDSLFPVTVTPLQFVTINGNEYPEKLKSLDLNGQNLTTSDMESLKKMTLLQSLDLRNTSVTSEQVDELQSALPNCNIVHNIACNQCGVCEICNPCLKCTGICGQICTHPNCDKIYRCGDCCANCGVHKGNCGEICTRCSIVIKCTKNVCDICKPCTSNRHTFLPCGEICSIIGCMKIVFCGTCDVCLSETWCFGLCGLMCTNPRHSHSYYCGECRDCVPFRLGYVLDNDKIGIIDAVEILKYLAKLNSIIEEGNNAWKASLVTGGSEPVIGDAIEILKLIAELPSVLGGG